MVWTSIWRVHVLRCDICLMLMLVCLAQDMVSVVVTLNRCMYAQLDQQEFPRPRRASASRPPSLRQHSAAQRGMKLAVGLEMLYARSRASGVCPDASRADRRASNSHSAC